MRHLLGSLGGVLLTLVLLTLLALLVTPPVDERPPLEKPLSISMIEAPERQSPKPAPAPSRSPPAPSPATPPPPPPPSLPAPSPSSPLAMPAPDVPAMQAPDVALDAKLPELATRQPTPQPEPKPKPQPEPQPRPEPSSQPTSTPRPTQSSESSVAEATGESRNDSTDDAASQAPASNAGPVSSPQPTQMVPPEYPSRARRRGLEGYVVVRFTIRPDGSVDGDSLRVIDAKPRHAFDRAALQAISRWQFPEAPAPHEARQRLEFRLKG